MNAYLGVMTVVRAPVSSAITGSRTCTWRTRTGATMSLPRVKGKETLTEPRAIQFYVNGIHPPRRHGATENVHGAEAVPRTSSP